MSRMSDYSTNCAYIRKKFNLPLTTSLYELVNKLTEYVKQIDEKSKTGENTCQQKLKTQSKSKKQLKKL